MESAALSTQISVYFRKFVRIAFKEHCWKSLIFAAIIAFAAAAVVGGDMYTNYDCTKSGLFALTSACIWVGIFNSIQSICKEHEIIRADYRSGMKMRAFMISHALWQAILCFAQTVVIYLICLIFIDFNTDGVIFTYAATEYIITMFLLLYGSSMLGLMVSSISATPTTAMTIMPFVLILQLIMSGVLFDLSGTSEKISYITYSKWGMSALGCIADLNSPNYPLAISEQFPMIERLEEEACYLHEPATLLTAWAWCLGIAVVCIALSTIFLKLRNHNA